jgi:hypothetical protein
LGDGRQLKSYFVQRKSPVLNQAIEAVASGKKVELKVHQFRKRSLNYMTYGPDKRTLVDEDRWNEFQESRWQFTVNLHQMADSVLRRSGVSDDNYATIHWRADLADTDYLECARAIVGVREEMKLPTNTTVFLMLSLMTDPKMQRSTSLAKLRNSSAMEALHLDRIWSKTGSRVSH